MTPCGRVNPARNVTFAEPSDWVLTVLEVHGAGLPEPQLRIVTVKELGAAPGTEVGLIVAE